MTKKRILSAGMLFASSVCVSAADAPFLVVNKIEVLQAMPEFDLKVRELSEEEKVLDERIRVKRDLFQKKATEFSESKKEGKDKEALKNEIEKLYKEILEMTKKMDEEMNQKRTTFITASLKKLEEKAEILMKNSNVMAIFDSNALVIYNKDIDKTAKLIEMLGGTSKGASKNSLANATAQGGNKPKNSLTAK